MKTLELKSDATKEQMDLLMEMVVETRNIPGIIVEIGSWKCGTSGMMALANPRKQVYAFDLFGGLPYGEGQGCEWFADNDFEEVKKTAAQLPNLHLVRGLHEETVPKFAETSDSISLLFMDSDFYPTHKVALTHLAPLVPTGGMIVFHDWRFREVQQAVGEVLMPQADEWEMMTERELHKMGIIRKK